MSSSARLTVARTPNPSGRGIRLRTSTTLFSKSCDAGAYGGSLKVCEEYSVRPLACQPRARNVSSSRGGEFGESAAGDIAIAAIDVVIDENGHAVALGVAAADSETELFAG